MESTVYKHRFALEMPILNLKSESRVPLLKSSKDRCTAGFTFPSGLYRKAYQKIDTVKYINQDPNTRMCDKTEKVFILLMYKPASVRIIYQQSF
jgi:hypothetical protein